MLLVYDKLKTLTTFKRVE